jgi:hypothetical protein
MGAVFLSLRLCWGLVHLAVSRSKARRLEPNDVVERLAARLGKPLPALFESDDAPGIFLAGFFRPEVFFPPGMITHMSDSDLESAILHEVGHVKAKDFPWTVLRAFLASLLWPNPLVWLANRRAAEAAEEAADEFAADHGQGAIDYAGALLRMVETGGGRRGMGLAVAESKSSVGRRIEALLSNKGGTKPMNRVQKAGMFVGVLSATAAALVSVSCRIGYADPPKEDRSAHAWRVPAGYIDNFALAKEMGWEVTPALLTRFGRRPIAVNGKQLSLDKLSDEDAALIQQVSELGETNIIYPTNSKPRDGSVPKLSAFLQRHPKFAYAEYALATCYREQGDLANSKKWYVASLQDAPVVLAQRVQYEDGRPLANLAMFDEDFRFAGNTRVSASYGLETDKNGCFYIPAWPYELIRGDFEYSAVTAPLKDSVVRPSVADEVFIGQSKCVMLPPLVVSRRFHLLDGFEHHHFDQDPLLVKEGSFVLHWEPCPGASSYRVWLMQWLPLAGRAWTSAPVAVPGLAYPEDKVVGTSLRIRLDGTKPMFNRDRVYDVMISAYDKNGLELSSSNGGSFQPLAAIGPIGLNRENLEKILPEGASVKSFDRTRRGTTVQLNDKQNVFVPTGDLCVFKGFSQPESSERGWLFAPAVGYDPEKTPAQMMRKGVKLPRE